ncbi:hypothetical protein OF122_13030 [Pelagibacterium flavum]|uniref:Uncharacterized protein n=1 Tax=Pelagibacterium flavum TaxID=2984530 RepID=A0ABY6IK54_9HYPH|nr:hypothetical protein [Pelagibacterium sp. YIM 151497]UYQ70982.1 hypothetical protein OF122_13030 [Pelagibacterium sp. YIM 151497]
MSESRELVERLRTDASYARDRIGVTIRTIGVDCSEAADLIERQAEAVALLDAILDAKSPSDQVVALKAARAARALKQ